MKINDLKFKLWDGNKKEMMIVLGIDLLKQELITDSLECMCYDSFENCDILQSIGKEDKNGRLIFDGDILKIDIPVEENYKNNYIGYVKIDNDDKCEIIIKNEYQGIKDRNIKDVLYTLDVSDVKDVKYKNNVEVIGNIYENKELLK